MAGPSVMVRVLTDLSALGRSVSGVAQAGTTVAKGMHDAFSGVLNTLNQTGVLGPFGSALNGVDQALTTIEEHSKQIGPALMGAGAALAGVGIGLSALGSRDQAAHQQLQASVEATGASYEDYSKQVEAAIKHQERFGDTAAQTQDALRILTQATNDPAKALNYLNTATDLAAAKHISLTEASTLLGKAYNGNTKVLKEFGIQVQKSVNTTTALNAATKASATADKNLAAAKQHLADLEAIDATKKKLTTSEAIALKTAEDKVRVAAAASAAAHQTLIGAQNAAKNATQGHADVVQTLSTRLKGQASAAADTFGGRLRALKATVEDSAAQLGQKYGPAITAAGGAMTGLGAAMTVGKSAMEAAKAAALGTRIELTALAAWEKATAVAQWALNVAMDANPVVLIVIAIAALVAVIILVLVKTGLLKDAWNDLKKVASDVWQWILKAISDVWHWIATYWPLLLGILLGPFALAAALIYMNWNTLVNFFAGVSKTIARVTTGMWHGISDAFNDAIHWVGVAWGSVMNWLAGLPGQISRAAAGMWHGIVDAFGSVYGGVTAAWATIWGWFTGLPGAIARVTGGMWHGITDAFRSALNMLIDLWNRLHFTIGGWKVGPVTLPKMEVGMPTVPHLAQGGLITQTGLIFAHAGEAITPMPKHLAGPAVNIENAHFHDELDVDALMRKAGWYLKTKVA